jgi:hypothetical protein
MIVEFSTENYASTSKDLRSKIFLIQRRFKSPASIRADEYLLPLHVMKGPVSVWTIESGLECGQWLPRKQRITVLMQ